MIGDVRRERWKALAELLDRADRAGLDALQVGEVKQLCRLYRQVSIDLSHARSAEADAELVHYLNNLAARAHGRVYASKRVDVRPFLGFVTQGFPRLVRRSWRPILASVCVFLVTTVASFLAVVRSPELAYSLFDEHVVEIENIRLEKEKGEYRGNFTFRYSESPLMAAYIIGNNIRAAALIFALGALLCLPAVLVLVVNGRMLGTVSGLVWNHSHFVDFYSLILTHGVLELTAICIAGGGGLKLGWALIATGALPRREALRKAAAEGFGLLGGAAVMLVVAGLIEAHITPHFPAAVRWGVATGSAVALAVYFGWAGRRPDPASAGLQQAAEGNLQVLVQQGRREA